MRTLNGQVVSRKWIRLEDGLEETDPALIANLESKVESDDPQGCTVTYETGDVHLDITGDTPTGDYTIPAGFVHASIGVRAGSITVTADGGATSAVYNAGDILSLPPMSLNCEDRRYPQTDITSNGADTDYRIHYSTLA